MNSNSLSRRNLLKGAVAGAVALGVGTEAMPVQAQPENQIINGAAYYRSTLGNFEITAISDGAFNLMPQIFGVNADPEYISAVLHTYGLPEDSVTVPLTATLVNTGRDLVLFDTGIGSVVAPGGAIMTTLAQLGVDPADITAVVITHAHTDHIGGNVDENGNVNFPNAQFYFAQREWDFWTTVTASDPKVTEGVVQFLHQQLDPLVDQLQLFTDDREILPGVHSMNSPGHTPGHCCYLLESDDQHLLITGDVANHHLLALKNPHWHFSADYDPPMAGESRIKILKWASQHDVKMMAYHFPFPGIGYALESAAFGERWDWIPSM